MASRPWAETGFGTCEIGQFPISTSGVSYDVNWLVVLQLAAASESHRDWLWEGGSVLLPLSPPLPDDAVSAVRGDSGMLGGLSVPLKWGVVVPPDDYDHWAPEPEVVADADDTAADTQNSAAPADGANEWEQWNERSEAEPHFDIPRSGSVIPHSPAAG